MTDAHDIARDQRQLVQMRTLIADFRRGRNPIGPTIDNLSWLLSELTYAPDEWEERFIHHWGDLEIPYALALDAGTPLPTASDYEIAQALDSLDALIDEQSQRSQPLDGLDP